MKRLHRPDLYGWSRFDEDRNIDFHSVLWVRPEGNVLIDPLPLSVHDRAHLESLGSASIIVITNSLVDWPVLFGLSRLRPLEPPSPNATKFVGWREC